MKMKSKRVNMRLGKALVDAAKKAAFQNDQSMNKWSRCLLIKTINLKDTTIWLFTLDDYINMHAEKQGFQLQIPEKLADEAKKAATDMKLNMTEFMSVAICRELA
jgi:predicted HicB family RNase H-like nuclease